MSQNTILNAKADLVKFREATHKFFAKELEAKDYKGVSGYFGSYAQKGGNSSMLRLRMTCGQMTKDMLKFVVDSIDAFNVKRYHFTTCQTVQLHDLGEDAVCQIMEDAIDHGIITLGGGGDFPRNVMCSPLSGVEQGEYFDVMPYGKVVADYLLTLLKTVKLPRKLKVGFSNSPANTSHATFRDLGFVARPDGKFDVYSAGGLGPNPKMGVKVSEAVEPDKLLYYVSAMVKTFVTYGDYENRGKSRSRYLQDTLGVEGYQKAFMEKLQEALSEGGLDYQLPKSEITKTGDGEKLVDWRLIPQKQDGLYAVMYHALGGVPSQGKLKEIYETIKNMDQVELRISPDQTLFIVNCNGQEAKKVLEVTGDGAANIFETSVSCIGGTTCQVGVRDSQGLLRSLTEAAQKAGFGNGVLPKIHISGCPSSCGTHQVGTLGFHGGIKMIEKTAIPAYTLHVNGISEEGKEQFGQQWGSILEQDIPAFVVAVGKAVQACGTDFETWYSKEPGQLKKIAEDYLK